MSNPNGPSVEETDDWSDAQFDALMDEQQGKESAAARQPKCTVCLTAWVDVMNGEDTCLNCKSNI